MVSKEYGYTCEWNNGEIDYWPKIPALVRIGDKSINFDGGLVDSGAQHTLVNIDVAAVLGIDLSSCQRTILGGAGGIGSEGYRTEITIEIPDFNFCFQTPVIFTAIPAELIFGQKHFFDHFQVIFEKYKRTFTLRKIPQLRHDYTH